MFLFYSLAATKAAFAMSPTREVLASRRRARRRPPERPTLAEITDDQLLARFEDAALRESGTRFLDDLETKPTRSCRTTSSASRGTSCGG
jgi:hypothetical protein